MVIFHFSITDDDVGDICEVQRIDQEELEDEESTPVAPPTPDAHLESTVVPYSDTQNVITNQSVCLK